MACNRRGIRRTPSPRSRRRKRRGAQPSPPEVQPNPVPDYFRASWRVPIQPLVAPPDEHAFKESLSSFPSHESTHPSAGNQNFASSLTTGLTSILASGRRLSIHTPPTPTSSRDGDCGELFGNAVQSEQQSPTNADFALRGIGNNSHYPGDYGFESGYDGVTLSAGPYKSSHPFEGDQWDEPGWISVPQPARKTPLPDPWNEYAVHQDGHASDVIEEGPVFNKGYISMRSGLEPPHDIHQQINSISGSRNGAQNSFAGRGPQLQSSSSNLLVYREDEPADGRTPGSTCSALSSSPIPGAQEKVPKCGIRRGPLTDFGKKNAKKMRIQGCCSRCFFMRERCVMQEDGICKRCRELWNKYRSWDLPCSDTRLDERSKYISPDALVSKLKGDRVKAFVKAHVVCCAPGCKSFKLSLTLGCGTPLRFDAIEAIARDEQATSMISFGLDMNGSTVPIKLDSPPILPFLAERDLIAKTVNCWVDCVIREPDSDFLKNCFPKPHERWEKEMLAIISRYHQAHILDLETSGKGPHQTLRWALKMAALNHIMSRPLVVPKDEVEALSHQLKFYKIANTDEWICPRLTNRIIKHMLLPLFQYATDRVLRDLASSKMLQARGGEDLIWDQVFCIVFICLVVVAKTQASLAEYAELGKYNDNESFSFQSAETAIFKMEAELSMHLIGMFHHRFGTNKKGNGKGRTFNPLARNPCDRPDFDSELAEMVRSAVDNYGIGLVNTVDLEQADLGKMKKENVMRLLAKFMEPFFRK